MRIGVGDDGAVLMPPASRELVVVTDTLVEGVHFPVGSAAASIGHRAFAVNLSDLAAMGAEPAWASARTDDAALRMKPGSRSSRARRAICAADTASRSWAATRRAGRLSITVTIIGIVPIGVALERKGGQAGDAIFVTGSPGDAAAGLALEQSRLHVADPMSAQILRDRFLFPDAALRDRCCAAGAGERVHRHFGWPRRRPREALRRERLRRGSRCGGAAGVRVAC